jgi:hypothetical protein
MTGWKLVPVKPTDEMLDAADVPARVHPDAYFRAVYRAMLAAAPEPPADERDAEIARWIAVDERLPTRSDADFDGYLFTYGDDGFGGMDVRETFWEDAQPPYITHFMPKAYIPRPDPPI